ncbi:hypothetical protein NSA47_07395 [Irregularibacter muris]|uniref:Uncharacterized protein n=1 Tax=Irregularibacter muris TaxID=1796619 RepID=A0AAE3HG19_9FIRM|nr:hypothetical protein [Irregularibacter muris]MCR1898807.1 hypothetical protein [Irregularibacter muris]
MRKMDEMEMAISLQSIKWAWLYTVLFLFIWTVIDYVRVGKFNSLAFILLISQNIIKLGMDLYLKGKMDKDEE